MLGIEWGLEFKGEDLTQQLLLYSFQNKCNAVSRDFLLQLLIQEMLFYISGISVIFIHIPRLLGAGNFFISTRSTKFAFCYQRANFSPKIQARNLNIRFKGEV